jgi:hypothetical protein
MGVIGVKMSKLWSLQVSRYFTLHATPGYFCTRSGSF